MRAAEKKFKPTSSLVLRRLPYRFIRPLFLLRKNNFSPVIRTVSDAVAGFFCFRPAVIVGLYSSRTDKNARSPLYKLCATGCLSIKMARNQNVSHFTTGFFLPKTTRKEKEMERNWMKNATSTGLALALTVSLTTAQAEQCGLPYVDIWDSESADSNDWVKIATVKAIETAETGSAHYNYYSASAHPACVALQPFKANS